MVNSKCHLKNNNNRGHVFMLESNELDLAKLVGEKRRNAQSERTIEMYVRFMTELDETINRPCREATEEDISQ
jgi:hypothetical protein